MSSEKTIKTDYWQVQEEMLEILFLSPTLLENETDHFSLESALAIAQTGRYDLFHKIQDLLRPELCLRLDPTQHPLSVSMQYGHHAFAENMMVYPASRNVLGTAFKFACFYDSLLVNPLLYRWIQSTPCFPQDDIYDHIIPFMDQLIRSQSPKLVHLDALIGESGLQEYLSENPGEVVVGQYVFGLLNTIRTF
jgi:hypothetical protein